MAEKIGSPGLNDPMGREERIVNESLERLERIVDKVLPTIVNRPFGSEKQSDEDLVRDWVPIMEDRGQLEIRLAEMMNQEGEARGRQMFVDTILKVQKLSATNTV